MGLIERIAPLVPNDRVVFSYSVSADLDEWAHFPFFKRDGRLVPDGRGWGQIPDDDPEATGDPREDYEGFTRVEIAPWSILVQEPLDVTPPLAFRLHELLLDLIAGGTLVRVPDPGESALPWDRDPEALAAVVGGVFAELAAWRRANPRPGTGRASRSGSSSGGAGSWRSREPALLPPGGRPLLTAADPRAGESPAVIDDGGRITPDIPHRRIDIAAGQTIGVE